MAKDEQNHELHKQEHTRSLSSFGFEQLGEEPRQLRNEVLRLEKEVNDLSVKHYKVHIENSRCIAKIVEGAKDIRECSKCIKAELPKLKHEIENFQAYGTQISEAHKRNRQTLEHHGELLELLEIPQLMDTCVRNALYSEALELRHFAHSLLLRHQAIYDGLQRVGKTGKENSNSQKASMLTRAPETGSGINIIKSIVKDVDALADSMRKQLLHQLKGKVNLLTSLRLISNLRRLDNQSLKNDVSDGKGSEFESEQSMRLRIEFLECRNIYLSNLMSDLQSNRPYQSLVSLIKRSRENWFDIITQYRTIFSSDDDQMTKASNWICTRIAEFLIRLQKDLALIDDCGSMANVLEQSMYFGASLSRVGADFRPLLVPIFSRRIVRLMEDFWQESFQHAYSLIESGEWGSPLPVPKDETNSAQKCTNNVLDDEEEAEGSKKKLLDLAPPSILLSFPIIATLVNGILSSFNELRNFASPLIAVQLGERLQGYLADIPVRLRTYKEDRPAEVLAETQGRYNELCSILSSRFLPYIRKCFDAIFEIEGNYSALALKSKSKINSLVRIGEIQQEIDSLPVYTEEKRTATSIENQGTLQEEHITSHDETSNETKITEKTGLNDSDDKKDIEGNKEESGEAITSEHDDPKPSLEGS